jgi:acetyltransferase-like isoleucine patch superfamily enzyme
MNPQTDLDFLPLSLDRAIADFPVGNIPLRAHRAALGAGAGMKVHPHAWIDPAEFSAFADGGAAEMLDVSGEVLISIGGRDGGPMRAERSFLIRYPWDLLRANEACLASLRVSSVEAEVHPLAVVEGVLVAGKGTRILPGVYIEGTVVIGEGCRIGPNCHLRGYTSIGDRCHIGQSVEIKNSLILDGTNIGHLSYVGDSVIGASVNFGAGTTVSNLRHDGANHRSEVGGVLVDTGRRKFGVIVADRVHTGIQTSLYPGRKLWPGVSTLPGEVVRRDLRPERSGPSN